MSVRLIRYKGPDALARAITKFRRADQASQFGQVQKTVRAKAWTFLRELVSKTDCVRDGLFCELPRGFTLGPEIEKDWSEKRREAAVRFNRLSDLKKAERIREAERLRQDGFLRLLILETNCVQEGFIENFPRLSFGANTTAFERSETQRNAAVDLFKHSTNQQRLERLSRIVALKQWRALTDLVKRGRIGLLGFPGEMPEAMTSKHTGGQTWESDIAEAARTFGNLAPAQKAERLTEALVFQQTRFLRELLRASLEDFGLLVECVPSAILADADADEKWIHLRLRKLLKSPDAEISRVHRMQRLRSEPLDNNVARHLGIENDPSLFAAWREGWMAFLRSRSTPFSVIPEPLSKDPEVVLGALRKGLEMYDSERVLGVKDGRTDIVFKDFALRASPPENDSSEEGNLAGDHSAVRVLKTSVHWGAPDVEWREGGVADNLEGREAWAWAWRRHLLLKVKADEVCEPPLQLRNIPQVLEVWAMRSLSNMNSEHSLDKEHGMPFPAVINVTLLNGGLLDCWAHAWEQFARRSDKTRAFNAVPSVLRLHPLIEALCKDGLVLLPTDIAERLASVDKTQRAEGRTRLLKELKRTPIPFVLIPETLTDDPEIRSAWTRGWRDFFGENALPKRSIPVLLSVDQQVIRAWRGAWSSAVEQEMIPWHCLPECLRAEKGGGVKLVEKWFSLALEREWICAPVPDNFPEKEALFLRWVEAWYVLPQQREFSLPESDTRCPPEMSQENWVQFLSRYPVDAPSEIPEVWRQAEEVQEAWKQGWVLALKQNAVCLDKIPKDLLLDQKVFEACRAGWEKKARLEPMSLWELPEHLWADSCVVASLVKGWTERIADFSEEDLWILPRRAWLSPLTESSTSQTSDKGLTVNEGADSSSTSWQAPLPALWVKADSEIKKALLDRCTKMYAPDSKKLNLAMKRFELQQTP